LHSLTGEAKHEAFYLCWTRKEAYIKARGLGLSLSLDLFDVSLLPSDPARLLESRESPDEVSRWSLRSLSPGSGYTGAIVAEGQQWLLRSWQWSSD
jgi:4'-phosphopantetheinyl transferase